MTSVGKWDFANSLMSPISLIGILAGRFVRLGLGVAIHLVKQSLHLIFRLSNFLREMKFFFCQLIHLETLVRACELVMRRAVERVRLHRHAKVFDRFLRIVLHHETC